MGKRRWPRLKMAPAQDGPGVETIHQALAPPNRLPEVHCVDGAYPSGAKLARSQRDYQIDLLGPMRQEHSGQAQAGQALDISHLQSD